MMDLPLRQNDVCLVKDKVKKARNVIRIFPFSSVGFGAPNQSLSVVRVFPDTMFPVMTMRTPLCNANRPYKYSQLLKKITIRRTHNQSKQLYTNHHQL